MKWNFLASKFMQIIINKSLLRTNINKFMFMGRLATEAVSCKSQRWTPRCVLVTERKTNIMKTFRPLHLFFNFNLKKFMIFSLLASRYHLIVRSRSYFLELVHKFSFYDCFFFVNEFDIHKFVIYYANGHLNYLWERDFPVW